MRLPKIAANVTGRDRVGSWLEFHAQTPVRFLFAPAGSGKTTCAVLYARSRSNTVGFVTLLPASTEGDVIAAVSQSLGLRSATSYADLVELLTLAAPAELIIDNVDNATAGARELLGRVYLDVPDGVTFVYLARCKDAISLEYACARGLAEACDPALFAFDANEIARLAASLEIGQDVLAASRLAEATHGWAVAVAGACRAAAANRLRLSDGLSSWLRANTSALAELVNDVLAHVPTDVASSFAAYAAYGTLPPRDALESFLRYGLFVSERGGDLALNPLLRPDGARPPTGAVAVPPAVIEMFGRFEMSIRGKTVDWIRRRDRQIVQFIAMQPNGRATRAEIIAAFWPDADRQLAGQSLRTACSTIRRAIGACAGRENVSHYFVGEYVVAINLENTIVSARQFARHCELAEAAYICNDRIAAFDSYRAAEALYRSPFLAGEPPAAWAAPFEQNLASMNDRLVARLAEINVRRTARTPQPPIHLHPVHRVSA